MVWLHTKRVPEEKRKQKQGSWDHCLEIAYQPQPCQHQVTLGSRRTDREFSSSGSMRCACTIYNSIHCCPASWSRELSYHKMEMCLGLSFQSKQLVRFIFIASNTLNLFKMYVKIAQYDTYNITKC